MQVLKLTAICDQPSSRSTTLRSFMSDKRVACVKAAQMTPAVDGKSLIYVRRHQTAVFCCSKVDLGTGCGCCSANTSCDEC